MASSSSPGIIYALVARGTCVLAEFTTTSGNFTTVTRRILEKLPSEDSKMSYVYDAHIFHYAVEGGLVFMCMADGDFGRRLPFAFIDDVLRRWTETYADRGQTALAYGMNEDFSRVLQRQMDFFSRNLGGDSDRVHRVQGEIDEVRSVMVENIERVLQRGEKIELLVDKTENLNQQAFRFKKQSTVLRRTMWCKNVKLWLLFAGAVGLIVLLISMGICGATFSKCRAHPSPPPPANPYAAPPPPHPPKALLAVAKSLRNASSGANASYSAIAPRIATAAAATAAATAVVTPAAAATAVTAAAFARQPDNSPAARALSTLLATACSEASEAACDADTSCTWCKCGALPSQCWTLEDAKQLPAGVYTCDAKAEVTVVAAPPVAAAI